MRIVQIVADGTPGGGTTFVLALIQALTKETGGEMHLVTQEGSFLLERGREAGAQVHGADFFRSRIDPTVPWRLRSILREIRPDVIHIHGGRAAFFLSFIPWLGFQPKRIYTVHGYHFLPKRLPARLLGALAERRCSAHTDTTVFVSEGDRAIASRWHLLPRHGASRLIVNAIDTSSLPSADQPKPRHVVFSGRLVYQKDPLLFVDIARALAPAGYTFTMLGSGDMESSVRERVNEYGLQSVLQLHTGLGRPEALEHLRSAAVCVMTSRWEGLPLVPLEAMAMGVPVIAPSIPGLTEVIESGTSGILVNGRAPDDFAGAIRQLCENEVFRASVVTAGRRRIADVFSHDEFLARYRELYGLPPRRTSLVSSG